jgi:radical SAM protein with 4Fe4S-binding SPASM domain
MGVYHLALGGGESLGWEQLISLARLARELGMTPNLTTAGLNLTPRVARHLDVFERIHLSMDGVGSTYARVRGHDSYASALMGLKILRAHHGKVGVNCVVTRDNAEELEPLFGLLARLRVRQVELLRFKPVGRGARLFHQLDPTPEQTGSLLGNVLALSMRYRLRVRLDCSFTPVVCSSGLEPMRLANAGVAGCVGGSWLLSIDPRGKLAGCSFDTTDSPYSWRDLGKPEAMKHFLSWTREAAEPCASCRWLHVCRGGCHVVARHVTGSFAAPDPGCPWVNAAKTQSPDGV